MPETTYMKVDPRRDHGFHIPRPDRTISLGIPNACHRCHQDKSAEWAETELRKLHGPEKPRPQRLEFARTIALGRQGDPKAKDGLLRLINDAEVPPLVRGAAVTLVASLPESNASPPLTNWLQDPEPMVRVRAARSLADRIGAPGFGAAEQARLANLDPAAVKAMAERLKDPVAPVRMEAARALAGVPVDRLPPDAPAALEEGIRAYEAAQRELADDPAGCINLAALAVARGRPDEARVWLERALQRDAAAHLARMNLAWLDLESGRRAEALARFEEVAARLERDLVAEQARKDTGEKALILRRLGEGAASAHDAVGLLLAESAGPTETPDSARARLSKAAERLELAVRRDPSRHRTWYNLGLARLQLEQTAAAANCFRKACELEPNGADYLLQLALIHVRANEPDKAKRLLDHLLTRHPEHLEARQWRLRLERTP
jgi:tetratricopeptide (TPR) repeat protein